MKKSITLLFAIALVTLISCKNKGSVSQRAPKQYDVVQSVYNEKEFTVKFNFPDTIYKDSIYLGAIFYENIIDTINSHLSEVDEREIIYTYQLKNNTQSVDEKKCDTMYGFSDKGRLVFANEFMFKELGVNYIDGYVKDQVFLRQKNGKTRYIKKRYRVAHELFVIDKKSQMVE